MFLEPSAELDRLVYRTIGAAIEVHRVLGPGYGESIYEHAMGVELELRGIPFQRQARFEVEYKEHTVGVGRNDLLIAEQLIVELKAVDYMTPLFNAQLLSYLKARKFRLGLLINFNESVLRDGIRRLICSH